MTDRPETSSGVAIGASASTAVLLMVFMVAGLGYEQVVVEFVRGLKAMAAEIEQLAFASDSHPAD